MEVVAVVDGVRSVHNVASMFRTADASGVSHIYLCGITPAPLDRFKKVRSDFSKVALGSENYVDWTHRSSVVRTIATLKRRGYYIVAVEQDERAISCYKFSGEKQKKVAFVFGGEVNGVSARVLNLADRIIEIPMRGRKESLNVAVAFGVIVFLPQFKK